jgi:asparagine synthetase B (glutamine-hydrolysing)
MKTPTEPFSLSQGARPIDQLHDELSKSLRLRVVGIPRPPSAGEADARVAVLFSGGLDCAVLARLASDLVPPTQPIDLLNVAFENPRIASQFPGKSQDELYELCPDRITGRRSFAELLRTCSSRTWHFVTVSPSHASLQFATLELTCLGKHTLYGNPWTPRGDCASFAPSPN